jgi:hypothetical protein
LADVSPLLIEADLAEARVQDLVRVFQENAIWQPEMIAWASALRKSEVPIPLEESIRTVSQRMARSWLLARKLSDVLKTKELQIDPATGRFPQDPNMLLQFSVAARDKFGEESRYHNATFSTGFVIDFLMHVSRSNILGTDMPKIDEWMKTEFSTTVQMIQIAITKGRTEKNLSLEKWTPAVSLLLLAGKVALYLIEPKYREFLKKIEKQNLSLERLLWIEKRFFGMSRSDVAQLFALCIPHLHSLSKVFILLHEPERGEETAPNSQAQANIQGFAFETGAKKK